MNDLKDKGISFIQTKYEELDQTDMKDIMILKKIKRFIDSYENDEKIDMLDDDLQLILYNNRDLIKKNMKKI